MAAIDELLNNLPKWHRQALLWFQERVGQEIGWP
jgi:hypothetical protein